MLSSHTLEKGYQFNSEEEKYVIVIIVDGDPLGLNLPVAHNSLHNEETGVKIDGGLVIIYVNATKVNKDTEVGRLMKDFHQKNAEDMEDSVLKEAVQHYKETEEGIKYMTETLQEYFKEFVVPYEQAAMVQGEKKEALKLLRRMIARGDTDAEILEILDTTPEEIEEIRKSMN